MNIATQAGLQSRVPALNELLRDAVTNRTGLSKHVGLDALLQDLPDEAAQEVGGIYSRPQSASSRGVETHGSHAAGRILETSVENPGSRASTAGNRAGARRHLDRQRNGFPDLAGSTTEPAGGGQFTRGPREPDAQKGGLTRCENSGVAPCAGAPRTCGRALDCGDCARRGRRRAAPPAHAVPEPQALEPGATVPAGPVTASALALVALVQALISAVGLLQASRAHHAIRWSLIPAVSILMSSLVSAHGAGGPSWHECYSAALVASLLGVTVALLLPRHLIDDTAVERPCCGLSSTRARRLRSLSRPVAFGARPRPPRLFSPG